MIRNWHRRSWKGAPGYFLFVLAVAQTAVAQTAVAQTAVAQTAVAQEGEPRTQVLLMLPFASGVGFVHRDPVRPISTPSTTTVDADGQVRTTPGFSYSPHEVGRAQYTWFGLSIGHDWSRTVRTELYAALVGADEMRPRGLIGLRAGPVLPLLSRDNAAATEVAMRFVAMGGIAYRGQLFEWIHASDWRAQSSLALTVTPALEATYYSSPSLGWTLRVKPELSYVIDQIGSPVWDDSEMGDYWDAYRWGLAGGIDVGVVF